MTTVKWIRRIRGIFLLLFAVSILVFLVTLFYGPEWLTPAPVEAPAESPGGLITGAVGPPAIKNQLLHDPVTIVTMMCSVISALGVVATTIIGWRKERREGAKAALELEKMALENAKLRRELDAKGATEEPPV